jgi:cytochrome c oxidase subunit 2
MHSRALALLTAALAAAGCELPPEPQERAAVLFENCAPCHGPDGHGNATIGAPHIAGQESWYLERQLQKFRTGVRGSHPDDNTGLRMRPMSRLLRNDEDVKAIAEYVSKLPVAAEHAATLEGAHPDKGKDLYAVCAACHGQDGKGNQAMNAPALHHLDDWYVATQITKFRSGVRGANPADVEGAQMAPMSRILPDEEAVKNVAAYIQTL